MPIATPPKRVEEDKFIAAAGKRRRGRPTADEIKSKPLSFKVTPEFGSRVSEAARRRGVTVAAFCVDAVAAKLETLGL